jgi:hypothetical protein
MPLGRASPNSRWWWAASAGVISFGLLVIAVWRDSMMPDAPPLRRPIFAADHRSAPRTAPTPWRGVEGIVLDGVGQADVVVHLQGDFPEAPVPQRPVVLEERDGNIVPRVVAMMTGQVLELRNREPTLHILHGRLDGISQFDRALPPGIGPETWVPATASRGHTPVSVTCDLHPATEAALLVLPHPYFAVTGRDGTFRFATPPGAQSVVAWHPTLGARQVTVVVPQAGAARVALDFGAR